MLTKAELRRSMRDTLGGQPQAALLEASAVIRRAILSLSEWHAARCVGLFAAQALEPLVDPLLDSARAAGKQVCFPKMRDRSLDFLAVESLSDLSVAKWGLREPQKDAEPVSAGAIDLLLVPGVAFTGNGHRLGRGAGFYDRFLSTAPRAVTVGVCFSFQLLPEIPWEAHDLPVRIVVSESGLLRPST